MMIPLHHPNPSTIGVVDIIIQVGIIVLVILLVKLFSNRF